MSSLHRSALAALGAAFLFGASTPFAKQLLGDGPNSSIPFMLAGLLYLGIRIKRWTEWDDSDRFEPVDSGLLGGHRVLLKVFVFHD
ncbi:hypothetical protein B9Z31_14865 [Limnohabitans sp. G3-2]|nr:hypothetical protein B9Z31_14865 [Limnohabitans sp. G3-2]